MRVSAKLGPCVWPRQRPAAALLPSLCRSFVCLLRSGDDGGRLDELTARLQELVRLAATRNETPARQRGDHANRGLFYRPEGAPAWTRWGLFATLVAARLCALVSFNDAPIHCAKKDAHPEERGVRLRKGQPQYVQRGNESDSHAGETRTIELGPIPY